jgi:signal transduction histidine kinase
MISEGVVLGLLVAANKPGGFTDSDVRLLSIFAGPAASFLRSRQIFERERRHAARLERLSELARDMASLTGRVPILSLGVSRIQKDFGCERVSFYAPAEDDAPQLEAHSGPERLPPDPELLRWALRAARPLRPACEGGPCQLAVPVRAGEDVMGVLVLERASGQPFGDDEQNLLSALAGQMAVTLQNAQSLAATERLARQMATLYDLGLETAALRDLRQLFLKGTEEAGRLIQAHHVSVFRFEEPHKTLRLFAAWAKDRPKEAFSQPVFRLGEGIAGRVAQDWIPAMLNDAEADGKFVPKGNPVSRLLCVPLTYYDREREAVALFGVLNATRKPGHPRFTNDDLEYLTRFAGQLAIAVANSMAFGAERERSEELALVNALIREIAGNLSRERIMETAARRIHEAFRYPVVMIGVPEPDASALRIATAASRDPRPEAWGAGSVSSGAAVRALHERRTVLVSGDAEQAEARLPARIRSELAVPIRSGEDVVAVLYVASDSASAFNRAKMITLETLADGIGIILRNAELYQALERTNAKLVELDRMKSEVVNIVAHDFRAPLAGVLGYAELLEWKPDAPAQERVDQARAIIQSATHMASMVDKTLKTTRLETGHFPFDFGIVDVGAVIREVLARLPIDARHPSMVEMPEDPLPCWADRDRVAEVLDNLLSNAAKYSPDGGKIRLEVRSEGETLTVKVTDSGIGIARQDMDRLFRPFSRLRTRRTAEIEGTGLGLYICERIVRAHGGRMWAESEPGRGSTFAFSLPLFGAAAQTRAPLLLVAAGDEGTRREVRRLAEELGYGIHEVSDGVEALEAAIRLTPSAVILDRVLPKLGAGEVAQRLKETQGTRSVPLFALAARSDLGEQARLFHACVPKPVDRNVLATALEALDTSPSPS